jgi:hypothetical protein
VSFDNAAHSTVPFWDWLPYVQFILSRQLWGTVPVAQLQPTTTYLSAPSREESHGICGDWSPAAEDSVKLAADLRTVRAWKDALEVIATRDDALNMLAREPTPANNSFGSVAEVFYLQAIKKQATESPSSST